MILNHADAVYWGTRPVLRIYCNGRLIWGYGFQTAGQGALGATCFSSGRCEDLMILLMSDNLRWEALAVPGVCGLSAISAFAGGSDEVFAEPCLCGLALSSGFAQVSAGAFAFGRTYGMVFCRGTLSFSVSGFALMHSVEVVYGLGKHTDNGAPGNARPVLEEPIALSARCAHAGIDGSGSPDTENTLRSGGAASVSVGCGAGCSVLRLFTVTFVSDSRILYVATVPEGNDCPDPVAGGLIDTPAKTGTDTQYVFTGWSTLEGSPAEDGALRSITGNRTVYAAFQEEMSNSLDNESWASISARALDGTAAQHYKVGSTKTVDLTDSNGQVQTILVSIAGFGLHRNTDGVKDGITWIAQWRSTDTVRLGADIDSTIQAMLPEDLLAVIRSSTIDTKGFSAPNMVTLTSTPKIFQPELTNISDSLTNASGGMELPPYTSPFMTTEVSLYTNDHDAEVFPLFSRMSKADLADFFSISTAGDLLVTRSLAYGNKGTISTTVLGTIAYNETYTLVKQPSLNGPYTFCFRI